MILTSGENLTGEVGGGATEVTLGLSFLVNIKITIVWTVRYKENISAHLLVLDDIPLLVLLGELEVGVELVGGVAGAGQQQPHQPRPGQRQAGQQVGRLRQAQVDINLGIVGIKVTIGVMTVSPAGAGRRGLW